MIIVLVGFIFPFLLLGTSSSRDDEIEKLYWKADFAKVTRIFENKVFYSLTVRQKLLYIECLGRTGRGTLALNKLKNINRGNIPVADFYAVLGLVKLSLGNLDEAEQNLNKALEINIQCNKAVLGKVLFLLYCREFLEAEIWFEKYLVQNPSRVNSYYIYLLGTEVFSASRNPKKMVELYSKQRKWAKKKNKNYYKNIKANTRLYKKMTDQTQFEVKLANGIATVPFMKVPANSRHFFISLNVKNKEYKVLLDTGNATGWIIHNRLLLENLKILKGGRTMAIMGTEAEGLDGYHIHTKSVTLNGCKINNLKGLYIPKPYPDFFDANFNPIFIRNVVVTIDCIKKQLEFRKKEVFERDISAIQAQNLIRLPWYGYERAFLPVQVNGKKRGLGMIETGAEDISMKLDFAKRLGYRLESRMKYLANGKVYRFFETALQIFLGEFLFERKNAEVWSFDRFYNRISGLTADVILGPLAFVGKFSISFDPFTKEIIIVSGSLNSGKN